LIAIPVAAALGHIAFPWKLSAFMLVGGGIILWSILPRPDRFVPPGPRLDPKDQPKLFQVIREVSERTGQAMPADVFMVFDMNAWVAQRGGVMGIRSTRVMGIGLPLLQHLTVKELMAVLAHEFGHYYGGDTRVGPWIYQTRAAIVRTVESLSSNADFLAKPFLAYGRMFLRITHAVSRRQEYTADGLAARTVGAEHLRDALLKIAGGSHAFRAYCDLEITPLAAAGYVPPVADGFRSFVATAEVTRWLSKGLAQELASEESDPYATHPPLPARLQALGVSASALPPQAAEASAIHLIDGIESIERETVAFVSPPDVAARLEPIGWEEVSERVLLPMWRNSARQNALELDGLTIGSLQAVAATPGSVRARFGFTPEVSEDALRVRVSPILAHAMQAALAREGWKIETSPGEPIFMVNGHVRLEPVQVVRELLDADMDAASWERRCADWGIAGIVLSDDGELEPGDDLDPLHGHGEIGLKHCGDSDRRNARSRLLQAFVAGGAGFGDSRLFKYDLTIGPFLWNSLRHHPLIARLPSPGVSKPFPRYLLPLRMRRIVQAQVADGSAADGENGCTVTYATFRNQDIAAAATALAERYRGTGVLAPVTLRDLVLRMIPSGGTLEEPILVMQLGDRRLFLQFDGYNKLCYIDDYSMRA
jgi:Zn-dependent protease with chaperone function